MYPHRTKCAPLRGMPIGQAHHNLATTIFSKRYTHIDSNMGEGSSKEVSRSVSLVGCVDDPATSTFEGDFLVWGDEVPYWDTIPWGWSAVSPEAGSACEGHPYEMGIGIVDFYIPSSLGKLNFTNQHKVVSVKHILDGEKIADDLVSTVPRHLTERTRLRTCPDYQLTRIDPASVHHRTQRLGRQQAYSLVVYRRGITLLEGRCWGEARKRRPDYHLYQSPIGRLCM